MSNIGRPIDRKDGRQKVTGAARYAAEHAPKNLAHAFLVTSTVAKGRVKAIDAKAAEAAPGVLAVLTHDNAPKMKATEVFDPGKPEPKSAATEVNILQTDKVHWHGQPVAVVVADTFERARHAASLVKVTYESEPPRLSLAEGKKRAFVPENVVGEPPEVKRGDAEAALREAAVKVDRAYATPPENHNPIEPHATVAEWDGDKLTVHDGSQYIFGVRQMLAEKFGLKTEDVRVLSPFVGGGFGCKGLAWPHVALAAAAAKAARRPVKLVLTREQMYYCVGGRTPTEQRLALGADKGGRLTALIHTGLTATSTSNTFSEQFTFPARHLYASGATLLAQKITRLDIVPPTFMRAPGETPGLFALESALDELAYALAMDPVELRLKNEPGKDPTSGRPFSHRNLKGAYALGAEKFGWAKRQPKPRSMRDGRWLVGLGVATAFYPAYQFPASAKATLSADGSAVVRSGTHEMGMGTATVQAQHAADCLGLPVEKVTFELGDTAFPFAAVSGGSSTTISVGAAVEAACAAVKAKVLALARAAKGSPLREAKDGQVEARDGGLFLKGDGPKGQTYSAILGAAGQKAVEATAESKPDDPMSKKFSKGSYGAHFCEVRVDADLGEVRVTHFVGAYDCGRILNAKTARSQFIGGITMGLGMALMEHTHLDGRSGRIMNANIAEYLVPTHADVPALEAYWLDEPDPHTPLGAHGIGEIGITGVGAAVANAVYHATGKRIRELPITPEKLL